MFVVFADGCEWRGLSFTSAMEIVAARMARALPVRMFYVQENGKVITCV